MRSILYLILAIALLSACQKEHHETIVADGELTFTASMDGMPITQSRAAGVDTDLKTFGFHLAGYHTEGQMATAPAEAYPNVFDHDVNDRQVAVPLVQYSGGKFTLKTIKWKLDEASYLNFYGWSQSKPIPTSGITSSTTGIVDYTKDASEKGYPWIKIRNADAPADQSDVVGARSIDHRNDAVLSAVDLNFSHLLSKFSFKAKSSTGGNATIRKVVINYAIGKVSKRATYTFNDEVETIGTYSSYAEYHSGTPTLSNTQIIQRGATIDLGSLLLIPQELEAGDISLEVTYNIWPNQSIEGQEQTKVIPLSALTPIQGKNYLYTLDLKATEITIGAYPTIEPWSLASTSLPLVSGPKGETLLLLDGYDKPYQHTDGEWYWLDRSGYNRHAKLEGYYNGMYDANAHFYTFKNTASNYALVPAFPSTTALSVDVVAQQTPRVSGNQSLLDFHQTTNLNQGGDRRFWTNISYNGNALLYFDATSDDHTTPGLGRLTYTVSANIHFENKIMWSFQKKDGGAQSIYENAFLRAQAATSGPKTLGVLETNIIGREYGGSVSYVKVTSNVRTSTDILATYASCQKRFLIPLGANSPVESDYVVINGLAWTKGNLVSTSNNKCKIGTPTDYGVYFQFGSLVGWMGGANGSGVGQGSHAINQQVWPTEMGTTKPSFTYPSTQGDNIGTLSNYFFNYSKAPWATSNSSSDIGTFDVPMSNDTGMGDLRNGRYAKLGIGDPCTYYLGYPWRLPTQVELLALKNSGYSAWTQNGGVNGRWFGPNNGNPSTSIFLAAAGSRYFSDGFAYAMTTEARYGASSIVSSTQHSYMYNDNTQTNSPDNSNRSAAMPMRCVRNL